MLLKIAGVLICLSSAFHDFHVSILNGELNPRSGNLEISLKVFSNDLEDALKMDENVLPEIIEGKHSRLPDAALAAYIKQHLMLWAGGQQLPLEYVGHENEQDITFIYLQLRDFEPLDELTVRNTIFFKQFDDQSNIVNIEINDELKSVFLEASEPQKDLHFSKN